MEPPKYLVEIADAGHLVFSDICLIVPGSHGPLWDGAATMTAVMDLMLSNIIVVMGDEVSERVDTLTRLQDVFGDFET